MIFDFFRMVVALLLDVFLGHNRSSGDVQPYRLDENMLFRVKEAMVNSNKAFVADLEERDADTEVFEDMLLLNRAVVRYYSEGICFATFRGATGNILDQLQSAPSLFPRNVCGDAGCCLMESAISGAYYADYAEEFESAVDECYQKCEGGCEVVLTGFSQGGAIASVAAIAMAKYNPTLITFAQHPAAWFRCGILDDMETYLRFVGTCELAGLPAYDSLTSYGNPFVTRHSGTQIVLGSGGAATVAHNHGKALMPMSSDCHRINEPYKENIYSLEAGPLNGFVQGSLCSMDLECQSKQCSELRCA